MQRALYLLLLWQAWCCKTCHAGCLQVPANITHLRDPHTGEHRTLKIGAGAWDSAIVLGTIAQILLNEGVGFATDIDMSFGGSAAVLKSLIGCTTEDCTQVKEYPDIQLEFENWYTQDGERYKAAQPLQFKEALLGYDGQEGLYFKKNISSAVWSDHHIPLEYYKSWGHPSKPWSGMFSRPRDIEIPADQGCRNSTAELLARSGLTCDSDGWFYSSACRNNTDECVPALLGSVGWLGVETCTLVEAGKLPFAVTFLDWPDRRIQEDSISALFFWWRPDWTYRGLGEVERVISRRHNRQEWNQHIYTTDFPDFQLGKFMWAGMEEMSPAVAFFWEHFTFKLDDMNDLMAQLYELRDSGDPNLKATVACEWVRANMNVWNAWIPSECKDGTGKDQDSETGCRACEPGRYSEGGVCHNCTTGRFSEQAGSTRCTACAPGNFSATGGLTACDPCPAGTSTEGLSGLSECADCPKGKFSLRGEADCDYCRRGTYANTPGVSACLFCEGLTTTLDIASDSQSACMCPSGMYKALGAAIGHCLDCPGGMKCPFGSDSVNFPSDDNASATGPHPEVLPAHWSSRDDPISVFICSAEASCPGGGPANCSDQLVGQACTRCRDGYTLSSGVCITCASVEGSAILFAFVPFIVGPMMVVALYKFTGRGIEAWDSWKNLFPCIVFVGLDFYQTVDLLQAGNVIIPGALRPIFPGQSSTERLSSVFRPECIGVAGFERSFIMKALVPVFVLIIILYTKLISYVASRIAQKPHLDMDRNRVFCVFMAAMFIFFNAVAALSLVLFKCVENPNKKRTLAADLSITCWDSTEWQNMAVVGAMCVLVYCLGFGTVFAKTILQAPRRDNFADRGYQTRWKFLFHKFRPTVWWWAMVYLQKNFLLNLGFVVMVSGVSQLYWAMGIVALYTCAAVVCQPYRARSANLLELTCCLSLSYIASVLIWFTDRGVRTGGDGDTVHDDPLVAMLIVCIGTPMLVACLVVLSTLYANALVHNEDELLAENHRTFTRALSCYMDLCQTDPGKGFQFFKTIGEWDRWYMMQAAHVVGFELLGQRLSNKGRLVDKSSERLKMMGSLFTDS